MKHVFNRSVQCCFQLVLLFFAKIVLQPFTRVHAAAVQPNYIHETGYLIIANHRRAIDPFIVCGSLTFSTILKILPVGFMTHNAFYDSPLRPLLWLAGCYPAKNPKNKHALFGVGASADLLKRKYSICIFPEGTRVRNKQRGEANWGVVKIHQESPQTPFILAHLEYNSGLKAWLHGNKWVVRYKLVQNPHFNDPESIMDEIFAL